MVCEGTRQWGAPGWYKFECMPNSSTQKSSHPSFELMFSISLRLLMATLASYCQYRESLTSPSRQRKKKKMLECAEEEHKHCQGSACSGERREPDK